MDSTKHVSSETSSDENDINAGTGRSYECTFCRRGFTNAQALGGHMNLHRKDKAKAKHPTEDHDKACKYNFAPISSTLGAQMNYQTYFPRSNPSYPLAYHDYPSHFTANPEFSSVHLQDHKDENLSLRIGLPHVEDSEEKEKDGECNRKVNEVDLELRLGHNQGSK